MLALISTILLIRIFYYTDPAFMSYAGHNVFLRTLQYILFVPILLWIVLFSNRWLYEEWLGQSKLKDIITYEKFQKLFTLYHFLAFVVIVYGNIVWVA